MRWHMVTFIKQETISIDGTPIAIGLTEDQMVFLGSPRALGKLENPRQAVSDEPEDAETTRAAVRKLTAALNQDAGYHLHRSDRHGHLAKYGELSRVSRHDEPPTFFELDHMEMRPERVYRRAVEEAGHLAGTQRNQEVEGRWAAAERAGEDKRNALLEQRLGELGIAPDAETVTLSRAQLRELMRQAAGMARSPSGRGGRS
jgi:hypothetical protein